MASQLTPMSGTMTKKALIRFNKGLLTIVVPLIRPHFSALFRIGGTLHGGTLTSHMVFGGEKVYETIETFI